MDRAQRQVHCPRQVGASKLVFEISFNVIAKQREFAVGQRTARHGRYGFELAHRFDVSPESKELKLERLQAAVLSQPLLGITRQKFDGVAANVVSASIQTLFLDAAIIDQALEIIFVTEGDKSMPDLVGADPDIADTRMEGGGTRSRKRAIARCHLQTWCCC